ESGRTGGGGGGAARAAAGGPRRGPTTPPPPAPAPPPRRDRVVISEYATSRVTERDLKGNILWQRNVGTQVISAQRLPNGHTFVAARNALTELDRDGNTVRNIVRSSHDVLAAHRDKDGKITVVT